MEPLRVIEIAFLFATGAVIGSFLNVCIWRLPTDRSIVWPGSHCPKCLRFIRWYDNIPLVSYAVLGARCRFCREPISVRYPLIEGLTALSFVALYWWDILRPLPHAWAYPMPEDYWRLGIHCFIFASLLCGSLIDLEHQILPDEITKGGTAVGLAASALFPWLHMSPIAVRSPTHPVLWGPALTGAPWLDGLAWGIFGALVGAGITWAMGVLGKRLFRKDAMGLGDVKLMAMLGAFFGWDGALLIFFIGPFFGLAIGILLAIRRRTHAIPYGPFLSMAAVLVMLAKPQILEFLARLGRPG